MDLLSCAKKVLVFLDKKIRPLFPFLEYKRTAADWIFYLLIAKRCQWFF